jgi:hypothetical protein
VDYLAFWTFIFRYFKVFQVFQMFTCGLSELLLLAVGSLVVFVLREDILKVHILVSSEHKLCQIWNICIVSCKTLKYLNINDSFHLKDLEISKYKCESKARMAIKFCCLIKYLYRVLYILIYCFFKQIVDIFFKESLLSRVIYTNYRV